MKMLFLVTDSEYEPHCMNMMREKGIAGYTVIPTVFGGGKTGAKMGDRVHPGASSLILAAVEDGVVPDILACVRRCVAEHRLCESTHAWVLPIEAQLGG
jgi:hypothetical protein